mmetsp:Transcript_845/g.5271  ORF Transcript_845/g.5271 Transcript_845/m.5271 type:complete len:163 (-) Transcript_845:909-1397(-)
MHVQVVHDEGYEERTVFGNLKIVFGLGAIGCAAYAHFLAGDFPASWWIIFACVTAYAACQVALTYVVTRLEKGAILCTKKPTHIALTSGISLSSFRRNYSDEYMLRIESMNGKDGCKPASFKRKINRWFYEDGELAEDKFKGEVRELLKEYEKKNTSPKKTK